MTAISPHTWQPYVPVDGSAQQLPTKDPITKWLYKIGQVAPSKERTWAMQHGRYLAGLGSNATQPASAAKEDDYSLSLELDDDVYGSGIFDPSGRVPTVHKDLGVFADHPSLPGYIEREVQFSVSKDISDITSGADVVVVPAGGMTYQEQNRFPVPFDQTGPTPCPPQVAFAPASAREDVYAALTPQEKFASTYKPSPVLRVGAPQSSKLVPATVSFPVGADYTPRKIPYATPQQRVGSRNISTVADVVERVPGPLSGFGRFAPRPIVQHVNGYGAWSPRPIVQSVGHYGPKPVGAFHPRPIVQSVGATSDSSWGWGTYAFAGLLVGAAASMVYGAVSMKKGRR